MTHGRSLRASARLWCAFPLALALGACATNPVSGKRELALISEPQEIALGRNAAQQAAQTYGLVKDPELQNYVSTLGRQLAANSERPQLPWSFAVVDDPTPNAFALPGGFIFVTRGLLALMNSEAELATVVGHEIGHVTARHSVNQMSKAQIAQLGLGVGMILSPELAQLGDLAGQGLQLLFLKYGRDDERQSDELGFKYALAQGYDVGEMANTFRALQRSSELAGASRLPNWMASHPAEPERIASVERRVAALPPTPTPRRKNREEYLRRVDGLVYGDDPRAGFFRQGTFYHPELAFQFTVPADWKTQNATSAVMAISPQQDAAFQLTLAEGTDSPEAATQKFVAQQGLQAAQPARQTFNGQPAVVTEFAAQAQQGVVQGYVAFVSYGGKVYQMVAYAPQAAFANKARGFQQILSSFGPLKDKAILQVQPQKLAVAKLDRPTTLAAFAKAQGGEVPLEQLALINGVDDPNRTLPAGTLLKRVTGRKP